MSKPKTIIIRNPYTKGLDTSTKIKTPSLTKQVFRDECDINKIVKSFTETGQPITHLNHSEPQYGEVPSTTYHESMNIVRDAEAAYADLPADVAEEFSSPREFYEFTQEAANVPRMHEMGLMSPSATKAYRAEQKASEEASAALDAQNDAQASPELEG